MDLVERESDLGALAELLDGLVDARPRAVVIEGPAGIGKSRLLAVLREGAAERGVRTLSARGSELEREFQAWSASCSNRCSPRSAAEAAFAGAAEAARPVFEGETGRPLAAGRKRPA